MNYHIYSNFSSECNRWNCWFRLHNCPYRCIHWWWWYWCNSYSCIYSNYNSEYCRICWWFRLHIRTYRCIHWGRRNTCSRNSRSYYRICNKRNNHKCRIWLYNFTNYKFYWWRRLWCCSYSCCNSHFNSKYNCN